MPKLKNPYNKEALRSDNIHLLLFLLSIEGLICLIWLLLIPKDAEGTFFGFSPRRLLLISIPLFSSAFSFAVLFLIKKNPSCLDRLIKRLNLKNTIKFIYPFTAFLTIVSWGGLFFYHLLNFEKNPFINLRLLPISVWLYLTAFSLTIFIPKIFSGKEKIHKGLNIKKIFPIFLMAIFLFCFTILTGLGMHTKDVTVNDLGVPLLEWQIIFICGLMTIFIFVNNGIKIIYLLNNKKIEKSQRYFKLLVFFLFWLAAALIWIRLPLPSSNYFAPEKLPPNFETYPFSDAERYSLDGQRILLGAIDDHIITKPLHAVYLAFLYKVGGLDYEKIITVQTIILALFPAILFLIGKEIHGNVLGLGMGMFAILREVNAIQASDIANVSNSKLLMTDFPSMFILSILVLITIKWIKNPNAKYSAALIGGVFGTLVLYRAQYLIVLPIYIVMVFINYKRNWKPILVFSSLFLVCLVSTTMPVLIRNYSISGSFWFDAPEYMSSFRENYVDYELGSTISDYIDTNISTQEILPLKFLDPIRLYIQPDYIYDVSDNFFRNIISTFLIFPIRFNGTQTIQEMAFIQDNFWAEAYASEGRSHLIIAFIVLVFLVFGLASFLKVDRKIGYTCLAFYFLISISTSVFRFSGWRFIMPIDWMIYPIFLLGFISIFNHFNLIPQYRMVENKHISLIENKLTKILFKKNLPVVFLFLFIGSIIPLRELFPVTYLSREKSEICSSLGDLINKEKNENIRESAILLCEEDTSFVIEGDVIHPRFFRRGWGFYDRPGDVFYGIQDFSRLVFRVLGKDNRVMYIPMDDFGEDNILPNGAHAIVLAKKDELPKAQFLILTDVKNIIIYSDDFVEIEK